MVEIEHHEEHHHDDSDRTSYMVGMVLITTLVLLIVILLLQSMRIMLVMPQLAQPSQVVTAPQQGANPQASQEPQGGGGINLIPSPTSTGTELVPPPSSTP